MPLPVGNDILDLKDASLQKRDGIERLIDRICSNPEKQFLDLHTQKMLWILWAAKETAFKVVSKQSGHPPVFVHRKFIVNLELRNEHQNAQDWSGSVRYENHQIPVEVFEDSEKIHAICADTSANSIVKIKASKWRQQSPQAGKYYNEEEAKAFSQAELSSIRTAESAAVRLDCKRALAGILETNIDDIEIIRNTKKHQKLPPYILLKGKRCPVDISFSHHGCWYGWVIAVETSFIS